MSKERTNKAQTTQTKPKTTQMKNMWWMFGQQKDAASQEEQG
jgi:hypothetical protein